MKITKSQLKQIIREELGKTLSEYGASARMDKIRYQFEDAVRELVNNYEGSPNPADDAFVKYFNKQYDMENGILHPTHMALSRTPGQITLKDRHGPWRLPEGEIALWALERS